jgi:LPXTG-site transpeptidase (sortase) family protein
MVRNRAIGRGRGGALGAALTLLTLLALVGPAWSATTTSAAQDPVQASKLGEPPTVGGVRPGPFGATPKPFSKIGVTPIAIKITKAQVDAPVEQQEIVDGVMQNPSGPFVVAWYRGTGRLGEDNNVVMAGHLDYWDVPEAVFFHVGDLKQGDEIDVTGEDNAVYKYQVDWIKNYPVANLDAKGVQEIVGKTKTESLTLITCGGPFDYQNGAYLERMVIRASRIA